MPSMNVRLALCMLLAATASISAAHTPALLPEKDIAALANELSGETAKRNLEGLARFHRQRGSRGFHAAAELVAERARAYGLSNVQILQLSGDGKTLFGTQMSRQAWDAEEGELSQVKDGKEVKIASYAAEPVVLAEDSESANVTADLVDVAGGSQDSDYAGKDIKGRIVLTSSPPGEIQDIAVGKFNAAGIVSYAQNQKTAWSGDNDNLVRWGHLTTFSPNRTFAFMVSLKTARALQERLKGGEKISLHAQVTAGQHPGFYEIVTATIEGANPTLKDVEVAYSCHLDHLRPGANDNASGCVTILEVARTLQKSITDGRLPRPARTIRFIWPPEIEGTTTLLNAKPEFAQRIRAVIHMDMVGGSPETKAVFHVTRGPRSLPSFVHDVAWAFASWVNDQSYRFAAGAQAEYPMIAPEGGKEPLRAEFSAYEMGSDHDVYQDSTIGIPSIYMNDWPDRYIHTNFDTAANIDPTKLKRAAFIGAASGYFLANFSPSDVAAVRRADEVGKLLRAAAVLDRGQELTTLDEYEQGVSNSVLPFASPSPKRRPATVRSRVDSPVFRRRPEPRGPMTGFDYDYFAAHAKSAGVHTPRLLDYEGPWGSGGQYAYEALNFADGSRTARQITAALSAEFGPVPEELVIEYLQAAKKIGVVEGGPP